LDHLFGFFFCRFFSLDKEKKRRKKRNLGMKKGLRMNNSPLPKVLFGPFSFKKKDTGFE